MYVFATLHAIPFNGGAGTKRPAIVLDLPPNKSSARIIRQIWNEAEGFDHTYLEIFTGFSGINQIQNTG